MASSFRRDHFTRPIFDWAQKALPRLSPTEREAIEAGDVWWDGDLFTGRPDWEKLLQTPPPRLSAEEKAFLDGPVEQLCAMLDDWTINWKRHDLPKEVWEFLKANKFFAMIIPKKYGGLEFSSFAHSEVVRKISSASVTAAVTVMVPNSLGPGELLLQFGTQEQRDYWLPRLADGHELPCFGLTSPEAGSDAASMVDEGIVCREIVDGKQVLGIRLNWHKRYITLAPIATVLGLAFKLRDPERLLGPRDELGITVALVPTHMPGIRIGRRHLPALHVFQNGPNEGHDVFIPMDNVIGGQTRVGQGWKMLVSALAAGRGISLPSLSAAGAAFTAQVSGEYARIRQQFGIPIGEFEAIQERLGRLAVNAYLVDAMRMLTCAALDQGHHPAVISAIVKASATERLRISVNDAMDIHGGKAIMEGPRNYLGALYRAVPVGITVEGANILTRALIEFGQGAIRSHPYLLSEIEALSDPDRQHGLAQFDRVFWKHLGHTLENLLRAFAYGLFGSLIGPAPRAGRATGQYRRLARYAASFAVAADIAMLTLGGALKRKEMLSARFGDILSELYMASAVLKRWHDEGLQDADFPLVLFCIDSSISTMHDRLNAIFADLPNRPAALVLRVMTWIYGRGPRGPADGLTQTCARMLLAPSPTRDRLIAGLYRGRPDSAVAKLERAFKLVIVAKPLMDKLRHAKISDVAIAKAQGLLTNQEAAALKVVQDAVEAVVAVDDFAPEELTPDQARPSARSQT